MEGNKDQYIVKQTSEKQERILKFLEDFVARHDYPPSIRDIQAGCMISSTSVVDYNLKALESKGLIRRDREISRGIVLVSQDRLTEATTLRIPIMGTIAAGQPLPVPTDEGVDKAHAEGTIAVTEDMVGGSRGQNLFALRVKGISMIDALINDGDVVIMESATSVDDGEMAAVFIKDTNEVTLKKFFREGTKVRLQPMNTSMQPIYTHMNNVVIQGRVVTAIRSMGSLTS
jgi:repressor LexA